VSETIKLEGISYKSLTLLNDSVLVRAMAREEVRASGLVLLHSQHPEHVSGDTFYGEVVAVGPGSLVREGPKPEVVAAFVRETADKIIDRDADNGCTPGDTFYTIARRLESFVRDFLEQRRSFCRVPVPWQVGDQVLCRQGHGPEIDCREGRFHIVERAGAYGHGIIAAWAKEHVHCWHQVGGVRGSEPRLARCACGRETYIDTRLPACTECPPGERLAEAVLGGKHVYDMKIPDAPTAHEFDPDRPSGFAAGEMMPEADDGRDD